MENQTHTGAALLQPRLVRLLPNDPIERYGPFTNLTFVEESGGHVTMRDRAGNEKRVYTSLFLSNAKFTPREEPRFPVVSCSQCGRDFGPGNHGYSHCEDHSLPNSDLSNPEVNHHQIPIPHHAITKTH